MKRRIWIPLLTVLLVLTSAFTGVSFGHTLGEELLLPEGVCASDAEDKTHQEDGKMIVLYDNDIRNNAISQDLSDIGSVEDIVKTGEEKMVLLDLDVTERRAANELEENDDVIYYQPNYRYELKEADPYLKEDAGANFQYHIQTTNAEKAWDLLEATDHAVTQIGVLDTGVDSRHQDLQENLLTLDKDKNFQCFAAGESFKWNDDQDLDHSHGTHVTGIIGATYGNDQGGAGIAAGHNNDLCKVLTTGTSEDGEKIYTYDICKAIEYQAEQGTKVINMSFGFPYYDPVMANTIRTFYKQGIVFVAASGNNSADGYSCPSDLGEVIAVNASTRRGEPATFSDYGRLKDISAPGGNVVSTLAGDRYGVMSGTSMSAPVVAAICGLVLDANPELTPSQVRNIICSSTKENGTFDKYLAYGNIDAEKAVQAALDASEDIDPVSIEIKENQVDDDRYTVVDQGRTISLSAMVKPAACLKDITWTSDNTDILTVDGNGYVTGIAPGKAYVTAKAGDKEDTIEIKVKAKEKTDSIRIANAPKDGTLPERTSGKFSVSFEPEGTDTDDVYFQSSDASILLIETDGTWITKKPGKVTVTVTQESTGLSDSAEIDVRSVPDEVKWEKKTKYIRVGDSFNYQAVLVGKNLYQPDTLNYSTSNSRGKIDKKSGLFTANKAGTCFVIAAYEPDMSAFSDTISLEGHDAIYKVHILKKTYSGKDYALKLKKNKKSIRLSWKKQPLAVSYQIQRKAANGKWKTIKTIGKTTYTDKTVRKGKTYRYRVRAKYQENGKTGYYKYSTVQKARIAKNQ